MNLGQIYTKRSVADYMTTLFTLPAKSTIVDPCFGGGVFIDSALNNTDYFIKAIEIDKDSFHQFTNPNKKRCTLLCKDFFSMEDYDKIDGIIMNPPYVRHEEINNLNAIGINKETLQKKLCGINISTQANLYMYFVLYGIKLLRDNGELIVIFPNTWLKTKNGVSFQNAILEDCSISQMSHIKGNPFVGKPMVDAIILKICKNKQIKTRSNTILVQKSNIKITDTKTKESKFSENCISLSSLAKISRGLTTGCNKIFINPNIDNDCFFDNIISSPKHITGFSTLKSKTDRILLINTDKELPKKITKYLKNQERIVLESKAPKTIYTKIVDGKKWYKLNYSNVGDIIFPYIIRENVRFIINDGNLLARDNFYVFADCQDPLLLMALLNNHYVFYQLELIGKNYGNGVLKIQKYDIDNLQIINPNLISTTKKKELVKLTRSLLDSNNIEYINKITDILSTYYLGDNILQVYTETKNKRLNKNL